MAEHDFRGPDRSDPIRFVESFTADYKRWNDAAVAADQRGLQGEDAPGATYARFLAPFLADGVALQNVAYGTRATFDPDRLEITATEPTADGVDVAFSIRHPVMDFRSDAFIAELVGGDGALQLRQIWYIDPYPEDGRDRLPYL